MNHPRLNDTSSDAEEVRLELVRRMTPEQRIGVAMRLSQQVRDMARAAIARRFPELDEAQARIRLVELLYGIELAAGFGERLRGRHNGNG
jgi:hypothetical protein